MSTRNKSAILEEIPSLPRIAAIEPLHIGITTRVMAKRQEKYIEESQRNSLNRGSTKRSIGKESDPLRRNSKFLEGATVPNSIIKGLIQDQSEPSSSAEEMKKERDEFVDKVLKRLEPVEKMPPSIYDESIDIESMEEIKKELREKSLEPLFPRKEPQNQQVLKEAITDKPKDPWEVLKEKRRISHRTSILAPLSGRKESTYSSLRKAIRLSSDVPLLINADKINEIGNVEENSN